MRSGPHRYRPYLSGVLLVARRDLRTLLRSHWSFLLLAALVALLGMAFYFSLPQGAATSTAVANFAQNAFTMYALYLYGATLLVLPALAAVGIATERKEHTLEQLRISCLSYGQIIFGKLAAVMALHLLLCAATLPVVGMVYFFAGVDFWTLATLPLGIGPFALFCASSGLLLGLRRRDALSAWAKAIGVVMVACIWPYFFGVIALSVLPIPGIFAALSIGYFILCSAVALLLTRRALRVDERRIGEPPAEGLAATTSSHFQPLAPSLNWKTRQIPDSVNPVYRKEQWTSRLVAGEYGGRAFVLGCIWGVIAGFAPPPYLRGTPGILHLSVLEQLLLFGTVPGLVVLLVSQEHDSGTLVHLRLTFLTAFDVLWGKLSALFIAALPLFVGVFLLQSLFSAESTFSSFAPTTLVVPIIHAPLRIPAHFVFIACCALPGALLARNSLNAQALGYSSAILGLTLFTAVRAFCFYCLTGPAGVWSGITLFFAFLTEVAIMATIATAAFALACRLYDHPRTLPS